MKKEEVNNQTIEFYIQKLVAMYGVYPMVNETALRIQFDHGLYAECVLEIMRKMGLQNTVKVICYADYKYPCPISAARIMLPVPLPKIGTSQFKQLRISVEMRESVKKHFYTFISSIAHELSHIVMHGTNHELQDSEVATDLCMLVFGFSDFVIKGKTFSQWTVLGNQNTEVGYLSRPQLDHAVYYLNQLRKDYLKPKPKPKPKPEKKTRESFFHLFKDLFR